MRSRFRDILFDPEEVLAAWVDETPIMPPVMIIEEPEAYKPTEPKDQEYEYACIVAIFPSGDGSAKYILNVPIVEHCKRRSDAVRVLDNFTEWLDAEYVREFINAPLNTK